MENPRFDSTRQAIGRRAELAVAWSRNALYAAASAATVQTLGLKRARIQGAVVTGAARIPNLHFNRAAGFGIAEAATEEALDDIWLWYQRLGVSFMLDVSPIASPAMLARWLSARNFVVEHNTALLYLVDDLPSAIHSSFAIQRVEKEQALTFGQTLVDAFGLPPFMIGWMAATVGRAGWHHYLAWEGDTAVAAGTLQIHGGVGHLSWAATRPAYRGRGAHGALILERVRAARSLGCNLIAVDTNFDGAEGDNISLRNVQRLGFRLLYIRPDYRSPSPQGKASPTIPTTFKSP